MDTKYHILLRICQTLFSLIVLGLSAYVAFVQNQTGVHAATQIIFLLFVPSFSIMSLLFLELAPQLAPKASNSYILVCVQALVSGFYMAGFIALSVYMSQLKYCQGPVCGAARADAVFSALSYIVWMASTTILGIEMSRFGRRYESTGASTEKVADKGVLV